MTRKSNRSSSRGTRLKYLFFFIVLLLVGFALLKAIKYFPVWYGLLFKKEISVIKPEQQRVNILLLGIGGGKHDGPNLTDTIIFASIDPTKKKITLVSIPRDLWIPDLRARVNSAYATGQDNGGKGLLLAKAVVGKVLGQTIDYGFRIDFDGFVKAVDQMGGIDIDVERSFDDFAYPVSGKENDLCGYQESDIATMSAQIASGSATESDFFTCRYEHLHFEMGSQHMDGTTALKYVRSRHALGVEGSDFSRSQRQEKVINAFKNKVFSAETLLNPITLLTLYDLFKDSIDTDIKQEEYDDFVRLAQKMQHAKIQSIVIDTGDEGTGREGLLTNPPPSEEYSFAWILIPKSGNGNFTQIQKYVTCGIQYAMCDVISGRPVVPTVSPSQPLPSSK